MSILIKDQCYKIWKEFRPKIYFYFKKGYTKSILKSDLIAGITVAIVALPLSMALAIASGVEPGRGIFTAIVAGIIISFFGGSRVQIGGPTGAFVVIVYDIVMRHGYSGLVIATILAGIFLSIMGFLRLGALIKFIPYPVITGFTAGIAVIIFTSQLKDFFGIPTKKMPADFLNQITYLFKNISSTNITTLITALISIAIIILLKKYFPKIPGPIAAVVFGGLFVWLLHLPIETIQSRFNTIPNMLPTPSMPLISFSSIRSLIPDAFTIALLAAIESLLCAVVADGMCGGKHKSNTELIAQGFANVGSAIFGGIPATGAIARTATNIKAGAKTPLSGIIHSIILFLFMIVLTPIIIKIPMASLAAILLVVAWNMSDIERIKVIAKAPKSDIALLLLTFLLTIFVDLNTAVQIGIILSMFLFIKKLTKTADIKKLKLLDEDEESDESDGSELKDVPSYVDIYEFTGPLFYGVADKLRIIFDNMEESQRVFILRMEKVSFIDGTGMIALMELKNKCDQKNIGLFLCEMSTNLYHDLEKFGCFNLVKNKTIFDTIENALKEAKKYESIQLEPI